MRHRLFVIFASVAILASILTVVVWVRSYWRFDSIYLACFGGSFRGETLRGEMRLQWRTFGTRGYGWSHETKPLVSGDAAGFEWIGYFRRDFGPLGWTFSSKYESTRGFPGPAKRLGGEYRVGAPVWCLLLFTLAISLAATTPVVRAWRRGRKGSCRGCGYDLRASSERCPECGLDFGPPPAARSHTSAA